MHPKNVPQQTWLSMTSIHIFGLDSYRLIISNARATSIRSASSKVTAYRPLPFSTPNPFVLLVLIHYFFFTFFPFRPLYCVGQVRYLWFLLYGMYIYLAISKISELTSSITLHTGKQGPRMGDYYSNLGTSRPITGSSDMQLIPFWSKCRVMGCLTGSPPTQSSFRHPAAIFYLLYPTRVLFLPTPLLRPLQEAVHLSPFVQTFAF